MKTQNPNDYKLKRRFYFELGYVISLSLVILLFLGFRFQEKKITEIVRQDPKLFEVVDIPIVYVDKETAPPPENPAYPIAAEEIEFESDLEIDTYEFLSPDDWHLPPPPPPGPDEADFFIAVSRKAVPVGGWRAVADYLEYPEIARKAGREGTVLLYVHVNEDGLVDDVLVKESLGVSGCDEAAEKAVRSVRFNPARQRDQNIAVWIKVPIVFALNAK